MRYRLSTLLILLGIAPPHFARRILNACPTPIFLLAVPRLVPKK
jgi:hypothetical protein